MKIFVAMAIAVAAIFLIRLPARLIGRHLYAAGVRDQSKWKRDLGAAVYVHSFRLTIALVGLAVVVLPKLIFGVSLFDM